MFTHVKSIYDVAICAAEPSWAKAEAEEAGYRKKDKGTGCFFSRTSRTVLRPCCGDEDETRKLVEK
jgi:hypothetical protein